METKEILQEHVAKTARMTSEAFDQFFSYFKHQSFKKGQAIITKGDPVDCEYFVLSGCLKTFLINDQSKMYILQFAMPTWWTTDYNALYTKTKATINVDCVTDVELLSITNDDRERICREVHEAEYFFRWRTNRGYVALQKRLLSFMNNDAKSRYEELLKLYPELYSLVPKHLIAAYLGVSRETLYRLNNS